MKKRERVRGGRMCVREKKTVCVCEKERKRKRWRMSDKEITLLI